MSQIHKLKLEAELKCSADGYYGAFKNPAKLPRILPEYFKSVEVLKGDGMSVGSVRKWRYPVAIIGSRPNEIVTVERIKSLDDKSRSITMMIVEGEMMQYYANFCATLSVTPKGEGCFAEWTIEFEKKNEDSPNPDSHIDFLSVVSTKLGDYLDME